MGSRNFQPWNERLGARLCWLRPVRSVRQKLGSTGGPNRRCGSSTLHCDSSNSATKRQSTGELGCSLLGAAVAARYAATYPHDVKALVLFAPIVRRTPPAPAPTAQAAAPAAVITPPPPVVFPLSMWAQYRRFVEDVPRGQAQVLSEAHVQGWGAAFLASDKTSAERSPASVITPFGPVADIGAMWSGQAPYDASRLTAPTLLVRGAWDSLCTDTDAALLMSQIGSPDKTDIKIQKATHLMHLEAGRLELRREVNAFLTRQMK
jgi:pimeloyl-ACP methyl ester carboxylesterase